MAEGSNGAEIDSEMLKKCVAETAIGCLGKGFDVSMDCRMEFCKEGGPLIVIDADMPRRTATIPGGFSVEGVPECVEIHEGQHLRDISGVLSFDEMSKKINTTISLSGSFPCGAFKARFNFQDSWETNASVTKSLAYDREIEKLYDAILNTSGLRLEEQIRQEVPSEWNPDALASFIEMHGTHVVVGISVGGEDTVHIQERRGSSLGQADVLSLLSKWTDDERFRVAEAEVAGNPANPASDTRGTQLAIQRLRVTFSPSLRTVAHSIRGLVVSNCIRRGGINTGQGYNEWLATVQEAPVAISMSFSPITSWLSDVAGCEHLSRAIDLYLRGSRRNILAINLDHFSSYPGTFMISDEVLYETAIQRDRNCFKPVKWNAYSHIYSAPLEFSGSGRPPRALGGYRSTIVRDTQ